MTYAQIKALVDALELNWQNRLWNLPGNPDPRIANGQVQFFDAENTPAPVGPYIEIPLVVAIGANFAQSTRKCQWFTPYLGLNPTGSPIASSLPTSPMRRCLDEAFTAYAANAQGWVDRCLASAPNIPVGPGQFPRGYVLLATNVSPFITFRPWQEYDEQYRANLLTFFQAGYDYLNALLLQLRAKNIQPTVFVGHNLHSEVPALFRSWQTLNGLEPWLITSNLSQRGFRNGQNAFCNKPIPDGP